MKSYEKGRFRSDYDTSGKVDLLTILRWQLFEKPRRTRVPVTPLEVLDHAIRLHQKNDLICWLSHASFLIQLGGKRILIDPVFGDIPFYKRQIAAPYDMGTLGKIDYLLISHTHYDHFDTSSIRKLDSMHPQMIVPLKMGPMIHKIAPSIPVQEIDWYETLVDGGISFTLVPARHWGRRGLFDRNRALWGGFILTYQSRSIYFAGDTAPGPHFKEISRRYDIDIALLPIGAYRPRSIMSHNHLDPQEAFDAFKQLGANMMVPMHYGTFRLSDEPLDEPLRWMRDIAQEHPNKILFLRPGEVYTLPKYDRNRSPS